MKIGLVGVDLDSPNKGCEALAYAALELLNRIASKHNEIYNIFVIRKFPIKDYIRSRFSINSVKNQFAPKHNYTNLVIESLLIHHLKEEVLYSKKISEMDFVIDFTGGDSFSDIYGRNRFYSRTRFKETIINHNIPLILGSQTVGPFMNEKVANYAGKIINLSLEVFVRDQLSYDCVKEVSGREAIITTDVAFSLPFERKKNDTREIIKVGLNVSGLLWNGGYSQDNQFKLTVDYKEYCRSLLVHLLNNGYEVHIIPHAFKKDLTDVDNDLMPAMSLHDEFPKTVLAPYFSSCIEAKSYIAQMDVFSGARMHSTIGAFSSGVPVIPFSYSRKFEGLFNSLEYPFVLNAREMETNECVTQTLTWIKQYKLLKDGMKKGKELISLKTDVFVNRLEELFYYNK